MKYDVNKDIQNMNKISNMIKESGSFEILDDKKHGRYTLKTATADVDLDTYSCGCGIESPEDVKQYEDLTNPIFLEACSSIAHQLSLD